MTEQEQVEYRDVAGFPGYRVGSDGTVWSCKPRPWSSRRLDACRWRLLKSAPIARGYLAVNLTLDSIGYTFLVHRLVLQSFIGPAPDGTECRHRDGNMLNNHLDNLCWGTREENCADMVLHGTAPRGENCGAAKLTVAQVLEIRRRKKAGQTQSQIAASFGIKRNYVWDIVNRKTWQHVREE